MARILSVDLGTTFSAAAVAEDSTIEMFHLGGSGPTIPSVVTVTVDGTVLIGDAAERRGLSEPTRIAREFKRRLGDPVPIVIGGTPYGAEALMAHVLRWIVARVTEERGGAPDRIVLTHPANYGPYKLDLLDQVGRLADVDHLELLSEPEAAAVHYYRQERIEPDEVVAVYDLGGGTFDAALVRRVDDGFELVGTPDGIDRFGGIDVDEAVFLHVRDSLGHALDGIEADDPAVTTALARLRDDCREAKEALSWDAEGVVPVMLPGLHTEVRLTRAELEDMIRPRLRDTLTTLDRVVRSAGLDWYGVSRVLLVGGSSRIPLVGELVRVHTGRPIALDANPKDAIALGAAAAAAADATRPGPAVAGETAAVTVASPTAVVDQVDESDAPVEATPDEERPPHRRVPGRLIAALGIVGLLISLGLFALLAPGDGGDDDSADDEPGAGATARDPAPGGDEPGFPPVEGEPPSPRVLALYTADYESAEEERSWGAWAALPDTDPPADIASDFYPLLGPYDSTDPNVVAQHMAWLREAGIGGLVVSWGGPESVAARATPTLLEVGAAYGVQIGFLVELEAGTPEELLARAEEVLAIHGDHPNLLRTTFPDREGRQSARAVLVFRPPEGANPEPWLEAIAVVRGFAEGTVVLVVSTEPEWTTIAGTDGMIGPVIDDAAWVGAIGEAWYVPTVRPGVAAERIGEPIEEDRENGERYRMQWAEAAAVREPTFFLVESFNQWMVGTQIEPAAVDDVPDRADLPYRTYEPLAPGDYLALTREAVDAVGR